MGVYASVFHKSSGQILIDSTDPSQANWITAHSDACKMPVPEVQRCWGRFLLLQPDKNGNVHRHRFIKDDIFNRQLVQQIPVTEDGLVTFQTYCSAVYWLSNSSTETKLGGVCLVCLTFLLALIVQAVIFTVVFMFQLTTAQDSRKVTDNQLLKIAVEMSRQRRDWKLLANSLGFLETDSQTFERKHLEVQNQVR
ncbi:UNVERIFIED_CONTAM: hypothetical protein FKN15_025574 [Acipenser sinensis]